jgi:hypothetical protein
MQVAVLQPVVTEADGGGSIRACGSLPMSMIFMYFKK